MKSKPIFEQVPISLSRSTQSLILIKRMSVQFVLVLYLCFSVYFVYLVDANKFWVGEKCDSSSSTSEIKKIYRDCDNKKMHNLLSDIGECFYWMSGNFIEKFTNSGNHRARHVCYSNLLNLTDNEAYRNATKTLFRFNMESRLYRSHYDCNEELPYGYFHLPINRIDRDNSFTLFPFYFYSREELFSLLKGKILWFQGNSLTRQMFQRIIMYIRGMTEFVEHFAHKDMIYGFDDRVDYWEVCKYERMHGGCVGSNKFWSNFRDNSSVALLYMSFTTGNDLRPKKEDLLNFEMYHHNQFRLIGIVDQVNIVIPHWKFFRTLNSSNDDYLELPMEQWSVRNEKALPYWPLRNGIMNSGCDSEFNTYIDDAHFQCAGMPEIGHVITRDIKTPINHDCSDMFNLNVIQRYFMFLFDERKKAEERIQII